METNEKPGKETFDAWHDDPKNWILGIFYYNKLDKRLLPPKRIKYLGWTMNFANPYSYLTLLAIIAVLIAIIKYIKLG